MKNGMVAQRAVKAPERSAWMGSTATLLGCVVLGLFAITMTVLTVISMIYSSEVAQDGTERVSFVVDNPLLHALVCIAVLAAIALLNHVSPLRRWNTTILLVVVGVLMFLVGVAVIIWAQALAGSDQAILSTTAAQLALGNTQPLLEPYYHWYPFQISSVAYMEWVYRIWGYTDPDVLRYINAFALPWITVSLASISRSLFRNRAVTNVTVLLCGACLPLMLYTVFLYPIIISCAFCAAATAMLCKFFRRPGWYFGVSAVALFSIAVLLKGNVIIVAIAATLVTLLYALARKKWLGLPLAVGIALSMVVPSAAVRGHYENLVGQPIGPGIPMIVGAAMGMQEGPAGPGWWNGYHTTLFEATGRDQEKSREIAQAYIDERLAFFREHPVLAADFYARKIGSQWINPEMESVWIVTSKPSAGPRTKVATSLYGGGTAYHLAFAWMNAWQSLVYLGAAAAAIALRGLKRRQGALLLMLAVMGGLAFHAGFEAKAQHHVQYSLLLIPLASGGIWFIYLKAKSWVHRLRGARRHQELGTAAR